MEIVQKIQLDFFFFFWGGGSQAAVGERLGKGLGGCEGEQATEQRPGDDGGGLLANPSQGVGI